MEASPKTHIYWPSPSDSDSHFIPPPLLSSSITRFLVSAIVFEFDLEEEEEKQKYKWIIRSESRRQRSFVRLDLHQGLCQW